MLSDPKTIYLLVIGALFIFGNLGMVLVAFFGPAIGGKVRALLASQPPASRQPTAEPSQSVGQTERSAGDVLNCLKEVAVWMKANTDIADAQLQPLETLVPFLMHEPKPKTGA